jgi:arylsulfatase A-like enzyme
MPASGACSGAGTRATGAVLVIFTSDNGGGATRTTGPSFQKLFLHEGGTRVPALVRWPGVIPAGRLTEQAAITLDWTATILGVTGSAPDPAYPLDGEDLLPVCKAERAAYDRALFWRTAERAAARVGNWKYLADKDGEYLFDLSVDPGEKDNRRGKRPETFEEIKQQYVAWNARMLPRPQVSRPVTPA